MFKTRVNWEKFLAEPFCHLVPPQPQAVSPKSERADRSQQLLRRGVLWAPGHGAEQGGRLQRRAVSCRPRLARLRSSLAPSALTRGRSRKETAPKRGRSVVPSRAAAAPTIPRLVLRVPFLQHEWSARLQHVGHRLS